MSVEYLKKATKTPAGGEDETRKTIAGMLTEIENDSEQRSWYYAETLDGRKDELVVSDEAIEAATGAVPKQEMTVVGTYIYTPVDLVLADDKLHGGAFGDLCWAEQRPMKDDPRAFEDSLRGGSATPKIVLRP